MRQISNSLSGTILELSMISIMDPLFSSSVTSVVQGKWRYNLDSLSDSIAEMLYVRRCGGKPKNERVDKAREVVGQKKVISLASPLLIV